MLVLAVLQAELVHVEQVAKAVSPQVEVLAHEAAMVLLVELEDDLVLVQAELVQLSQALWVLVLAVLQAELVHIEQVAKAVSPQVEVLAHEAALVLLVELEGDIVLVHA